MTREEFEAIALEIRAQRDNEESPAARGALKELAEALAKLFKQLNPRFQERIFFDVCGLP